MKKIILLGTVFLTLATQASGVTYDDVLNSNILLRELRTLRDDYDVYCFGAISQHQYSITFFHESGRDQFKISLQCDKGVNMDITADVSDLKLK
jgi:hypothetical protein